MGILEAATQRMKMEEARYEEQIAALKAENERLTKERDYWQRQHDERTRQLGATDERALADRSNAVKVLRAIAEGYHVFGAEDRYVVVANPAFQPDDGSDPCLVVDISTLTTEPAAPEGRQEAVAWYIEWRFKPTGPDIKRAGGGSKVLWDQAASPEKAAAEVARLEGIETVDWVRCTPLYTRPSEQAVTDEMVEAAISIMFHKHGWFPPRQVVKDALRAAMDVGRHD